MHREFHGTVFNDIATAIDNQYLIYFCLNWTYRLLLILLR